MRMEKYIDSQTYVSTTSYIVDALNGFVSTTEHTQQSLRGLSESMEGIVQDQDMMASILHQSVLIQQKIILCLILLTFLLTAYIARQ